MRDKYHDNILEMEDMQQNLKTMETYIRHIGKKLVHLSKKIERHNQKQTSKCESRRSSLTNMDNQSSYNGSQIS